ncbi:MAG TPA: helix-turn-helix transcriptional regulator [Gammaproteobacteria bacterium]|nr:helix-turn-helix transcriptional regulator [Gammaproteobacteria bacterium]
MAQVSLLVRGLKRHLKARGVTYAALARRLELSESSVKRLFATQSFSLQRLEEICNLFGLEISDLVEMMNEQREYLTELTPEQEEALLADPKLLLMTYLLINGWPLPEIIANFEIDAREAERLLIRLHRAKIIELLPFNRVKLLTGRNFTWRKNGPVQRFFEQQVQHEFLDAPFAGAGELFRFVGGRLSRTGLTQMQQSIERLAREFDELARRDAVLPVTERHSCGAVFAIRPWEFSMFAALRRKPKSGSD